MKKMRMTAMKPMIAKPKRRGIRLPIRPAADIRARLKHLLEIRGKSFGFPDTTDWATIAALRWCLGEDDDTV